MTFVMTWKIRPGNTREAVDRFLSTGDPLPEGIKDIGRWHRTDLQSGVHVLEVSDAAVLAQYAARWTDLLELETYAAVADAEAVNAYRKISGVKSATAGA
jgi:hypothetical protein